MTLILRGCSTYAASRYAISAETVSTLRAYRPHNVAVGAFTAKKPGETEINCRGVGPIRTPDGEPFEEFIRKAFIAELTIAEVYAPSAPVTLTGSLDTMDFASGIYWSEAFWQIAITIKSSNGKSVAVTEKYPFKASYGGEAGCQNTAQALMPAVQNLVGKMVKDAAFAELLR
jgi:hypothetical protein